VFFGIQEGPCVSPVPGAATATRGDTLALISLCRRGDGAEVLNELFCALVERLHALWMELNSRESATLMHFPQVMHKLHTTHSLFWQSVSVNSPCDFQALASGHFMTANEDDLGLLDSLSTVLPLPVSALRAVVAACVGGSLSCIGASRKVAEKEGWRGSYVPPVLPEMVTADHHRALEGFGGACAFAAHSKPARPAGELDVDEMLRSLGMDVEAVEVPLAVSAEVHEQDLDAFLDTCLGESQAQGVAATVDKGRTAEALTGLWEDFGNW
jgi:hypothetical protein